MKVGYGPGTSKPLYVVLPNYYAREFGVPLATLGAVLLGARLFDAFIDPLLDRLAEDQAQARVKDEVDEFGAEVIAEGSLLGMIAVGVIHRGQHHLHPAAQLLVFPAQRQDQEFLQQFHFFFHVSRAGRVTESDD